MNASAAETEFHGDMILSKCTKHGFEEFIALYYMYITSVFLFCYVMTF